MEKIDKFAIKQAIEGTNKIANDLITLYPYLYISSDGDKFGNKSDIKAGIKELKYLSYMLSRELLEIIDNEEEKGAEDTETWNGYHGQITAPKGTFKKIFEESDEEEKHD